MDFVDEVHHFERKQLFSTHSLGKNDDCLHLVAICWSSLGT